MADTGRSTVELVRAIQHGAAAAARTYLDDWHDVPDTRAYESPFKTQWTLFIRHVVEGTPFPWGFLAGAKGVQLAEFCARSSVEGRWLDVPPLAG